MSVGRIEVVPEDDVHVLALLGEHDVSTAPELRSEIERIAGAGGDVIVDLSQTEFIDSSIVGVLVDGYRRAEQDGAAEAPWWRWRRPEARWPGCSISFRSPS